MAGKGSRGFAVHPFDMQEPCQNEWREKKGGEPWIDITSLPFINVCTDIKDNEACLIVSLELSHFETPDSKMRQRDKVAPLKRSLRVSLLFADEPYIGIRGDRGRWILA